MRILSVLIGTLLVCSPLQSVAETVSPYVEATLERVDAGLEKAQGIGPVEDFDQVKESKLNEMERAILKHTDTKLRIEKQQRFLREINGCLRHDLLEIDDKLAEIQEAMIKAYEEESGGGITMLAELYDFLNERYEHVLEGALDPSYTDETWGVVRQFDEEPLFCCSETQACVAAESAPEGSCSYAGFVTLDACQQYGCTVNEKDEENVEPMCPFHTDYAPPSSKGYGCDATVLRRLEGRSSIEKEHEALEEILREKREYYSGLEPFARLLGLSQSDIQALQGTRRHKKQFGCDGAQGDEEAEDDDEDEEEKNDWFDDVILVERRGPFYFNLDHLKITRLFREVRRIRKDPSYTNYLKYSAEFEENPGLVEELDRSVGILSLFDPLRSYFREETKIFSGQQTETESRSMAAFLEPQFFFQRQFTSFRSSIQRLSDVASDLSGGVRGFARDFTFYIRRSCPYRACNDVLDRVFKLLVTDECFPYASGDFTDEKYVSKCEEESEVELQNSNKE